MSEIGVASPAPGDEEPVVATAPEIDDEALAFHSAASPLRRPQSWLARAWPYVLVAIVPLVLSVTHVVQFRELSPIDESRHVDYMVRLTEGHLVRLGDKMGQESLRIEACRGIELDGFVEPPCDLPRFRPADFRDRGYTNVTGHPPGYYLVTGIPAVLAEKLGLAGSILDPARLLGGVWLALGLMMVVRTGDILGLSRVALVAAALAIVAVPGVLASAATVNPDAASIFAGGLVLCFAVMWERAMIRSWWALAAVGATVAMLKMTNAVAVGVVAIWFLVRAVDRLVASRRRSADTEPFVATEGRRYALGAGALVGGMLAATLIWIVIASARATIDPLDIPSNAQFYKESFPWGLIVDRSNLFGLLPPLGDWYPGFMNRRGPLDMAVVTGWLVIGAMITSVLRVRPFDRTALIGSACFAVLLTGGVGLMFLTWMVNQVVFEPVARYSLSAVPFVIVVIAGSVRGRFAPIALGVFAAISCGLTFGALVT